MPFGGQLAQQTAPSAIRADAKSLAPAQTGAYQRDSDRGDDEISFLSERGQSEAPLEYSECSSGSSIAQYKKHSSGRGCAMAESAPSIGSVPEGDAEDDLAPHRLTDTSHALRGADPLGPLHMSLPPVDARSVQSGAGTPGADAAGGCASVLEQVRSRHGDKPRAAEPARAPAEPARAAAGPRPPRQEPQQEPAAQPQAARGPLVWILNVTCCPSAVGAVAPDAPGVGGARVTGPPSVDDTEEEWIAGVTRLRSA